MCRHPIGLVLVHGGNHAASCWDRLIPHLEAEVRAVDLPGRGSRPRDLRRTQLSEWSTAVLEEIDQIGADKVILVGHSLAGAFLPAVAGARAHKVRRLVLISAVIPPEGSSQRRNLPWLGRAAARLLTRDGVIPPPPALLARVLFCNDMDRTTADWTIERLVPEAAGVFDEPITRQSNTRVPTTYVTLKRDRAVPPRKAKAQIRNYGGEVDVEELDAGHDVMISHPAELAALLGHLAGVPS